MRRTLRFILGRSLPKSSIRSRISVRGGKELVLKLGLAICDGRPSWFYTAFDRGNRDPLTNYLLNFVETRIPKHGRICVTGCGTGITAFEFADHGFSEVVGLDLIPECIAIADHIKQKYKYHNTTFVCCDCFRPMLSGLFDAITVMHWLYSAWMGNYGNSPVNVQRARDPAARQELLNEFVATYAQYLNDNGVLILELVDAVTDYRLPSDHSHGTASAAIYPVRHTPEQVRISAGRSGLEVVDQKLSVSYGHHPRTAYILIKRSRVK